MELLNILKRFLMNGVPRMVVKMNNLAKEQETLDIMKKADVYIAACLKAETFNAYRYTLRTDTLAHVGIYNKAEQQRILMDTRILEREYPHLIDDIILYERERTIANYVEQNNYYRMLNGQPDLGDTEFVYPDIGLLKDYGFKEPYPETDYVHRTPLHLLPSDTILALEDAGYLKEIQEQYPTKKYISYIGARKIPIATARQAHNFELLYFPRLDGNTRFYHDFLFYYEEAREYFTSTIYNHQFATRYEYYDGFIGLMILTMTIQRVISNLFKIVVERDFYDLATLRLFLESFGVPFVEIFTTHQQRMLVRNLNILLMKKQGTQVMYDILDLLGYDTFQLTKYVLVKQHRMMGDEDAPTPDIKPIFVYRNVVAEDGTTHLEIDPTSTYDYYFVGVDMRENDIRLVDVTSENAYGYEEVTASDPTWIEDEDLVNKLSQTDFNFIETKYADIAVNIRMQDKLFETVYLARLLLDNYEQTDRILITLAKVSDNSFSLLEVEVFMICLMCKWNRMEPEIIRKPSQILAVLGFDFQEDLRRIKEEILAENEEWKYIHGEDLYDLELLEYFKTAVFHTPQDVNDFYVVIRDLEAFLSHGMLTTKDVDVYHAYRKLYNTLMITQIDDNTYKDDYGDPVYRYDDYLKELNIELWHFYEELDRADCLDYINYIATKFSTLFEDTEFMGLLNIGDAVLIEGLLKILRTFKSLTIDLKDMDIVYVFDSRTRNMFRLFSKVVGWKETMHMNSLIEFFEMNMTMTGHMEMKEEHMPLQDATRMQGQLRTKDDKLLLQDAVHTMRKTIIFYDGIFQTYLDNIHALEDVVLRPKDYLRLTDKGCCVFIYEGEPPRIVGGTPQ